MRIFFLMCLASLSCTAHAVDGIETEIDGDLTVVAGAFGDDGTHEAEPLTAEVSLGGSASYVLENGVKLSGNLTFRAQKDHPERAGFAGAILACPPQYAECASLNGMALRGGFSRLSTVGFADEAGARGSLERAYLEVDGGWGSFTFGRDDGVAARFFEGGPTLFELARDRDPILDPTGLNGVRTRNDISSTAAKMSYVTPRILGVRAGLSYTPDASVRRLDLDTSRTMTGVIEPELGHAVELGLQVSRLLVEQDIRVRSSLTWSQARSETRLYEDTKTTSFGLDLERRDAFRIGFSVLNSNNGGHGDYSSFGLGGEYWINDWQLGLSGAKAEDDTLGLETWSATAGVSREVEDNIFLTLGYRIGEARLESAPTSVEKERNQDGVLLELRIRK